MNKENAILSPLIKRDMHVSSLNTGGVLHHFSFHKQKIGKILCKLLFDILKSGNARKNELYSSESKAKNTLHEGITELLS